MMPLSYFATLVKHTAWANTRTLASLQAGTPPEDAVRLFAHLVTTEQIYYYRITGTDPWPQDFWPDFSLTTSAEQMEENNALYQIFSETLTEAALAEPVRYRNSSGMVYHTPRVELLTHLALHGEHHRGQIARIVRLAGGTPAVTDFISFVRR